jgi:parallel beta-helix repeat protein
MQASIAGWLLASSTAAVIFSATGIARAADLVCGAVVTSDVKLAANLTCTQSAIVIGADDVTLNLNGHTLTGTVLSGPDPRWSGVKTLRGTSFRNVRIMNGTIVGFHRAIDVANANGVTIQNVVVEDPLGFGILVENSRDVAIRNVALRGRDPETTTAHAILLNSVAAVHVQGVDVQGFYYGVRFFCSTCAIPSTPNSGSVKDSTFSNNYIAVSLIAAANVTVAGNRITDAGTSQGSGGGIGTEPSFGPARDLRIVDNTVSESMRGVFLGDVTGSWVSGNVLLNNVYEGIALYTEVGAGSRGNKIASNTALRNGLDVFHDGASVPNIWVDNVCQTRYPDDIPCSPAAP